MSTPEQPRFRGLRFHIAVVYLGRFAPIDEWEPCDVPPIIRTSVMMDIMHCPSKKGTGVCNVIEKQLGRLGCSSFDVVSGTGDGGGENEGVQGSHAYFEELNLGYVRRRCIPHISWRVCGQAITASELDYNTRCSYFCDGITWSRLREIATQEPDMGGWKLFSDCPQQCKNLLGKSPLSDHSPDA